MAPDSNDPRPPYLQVADDLRAAIADGAYKPGQRLPSGRELARRYGVAPMTIHHAVGVLRDEHLVVSYQGRGVFVADHATRQPPKQRSQDAAIKALRGDLANLGERVTRLEHLVTGDKAEGAGE